MSAIEFLIKMLQERHELLGHDDNELVFQYTKLAAEELQALRAQLAEAERERGEWRKALQHLTPTGSEFTTPQECEKWLRERMQYPKQLLEARAQVERMREALVYLKEYFETKHTGRILYPEYLEFHEYAAILKAMVKE